jgi:hypothetical protein
LTEAWIQLVKEFKEALEDEMSRYEGELIIKLSVDILSFEIFNQPLRYIFNLTQ